MQSPVIIKGNQQGLRLIISKGAQIQEVVSTIEKGLKNIKKEKLEPHSSIRLMIEGAKLKPEETEYLQTALFNLGIDTYIEEPQTHYTNDKKDIIPMDEGLFVIGNIRRGQIVEANTSIVILGDVEAGAKIISNANVVIIGKQEGMVQVGANSNEASFVYSMISGRNM